MEANEAQKFLSMGWSFWITFCMACVVGVLVNQLEQPFARSIISCDTPVDRAPGAPNPLSNKCGDRLFVIGEGARLSAQGQSLENICQVVMVVAIGIFADMYGRKPFVILAIGSMWASVLLFTWASFDESNAQWLFTIAQGIQGMSPGNMLVGLVFADIALRLGTNGADVLVKKDQILGITMLVTFWLSQFIAGLEIVDYRGIWISVACLISIGLYACVTRFPETMRKKDESSEQANATFAQRVVAELGVYRTMFIEKPIVLWSVSESFLAGPGEAWGAMFTPIMMSYFGYTQRMLVLRFIPLTVLPLYCTSIVNDYCKKVGYTKGFWRTMLILKIKAFVTFPLSVAVWWMPWFVKLTHLPVCGWGTVYAVVRGRIVGEKMNAKYESVTFLLYHSSQSISNYVNKLLFNEKPASILHRFVPIAFPTFFNFLGSMLMIFLVYPGCQAALASMDAELVAKRESGEASDAAKKTE